MCGLCLYVSSCLYVLPTLIRKPVYVKSGEGEVKKPYYIDAKTLHIQCKDTHNDTVTSLQRLCSQKYWL